VGELGLGEVAEEVVVKDGADAGEEFGVDGAPVEDVVNVGPFAIQLTCKPFDIVSFGLQVKNFTDMSAYVIHKSVRTMFGLFHHGHRQTPSIGINSPLPRLTDISAPLAGEWTLHGKQ